MVKIYLYRLSVPMTGKKQKKMKNIFTFFIISVYWRAVSVGTACQFGLEYSKPECFGVYAAGVVISA